ncbi:hypothetical protein [Stenotrophomonas maltophilia]|uniref:hypothetical protein n=2 Tax=Stenotrophomonas maltophilia TaxID=40324 RepID=UPI002893A863|nr:hypothetical protein [Stenotrophomonas maltophilia]MDT3473336.1 hypothetical protein [Stenotrophomonas maltophilia]
MATHIAFVVAQLYNEVGRPSAGALTRIGDIAIIKFYTQPKGWRLKMESSNIEPGKYKPRFDFGKDQVTDQSATGSINELLDELNHEITYAPDGNKAKHSDASGKTITRKDLNGIIEFINSTLGQEITGGNCTLPISTLKTIKLLYLKNDTSDTQLLQRISKPGTIKATFEHWTERNTPRNEKTIKAASYLMSTLELEIDEERLKHIHINRLTPSKLLECYARHIKELIEPIYMAFAGNDEAIASAFMFGAHQIESYQPSNALLGKEGAPVHERLYIYLLTLPFLHFVGEYQQVVESENDELSKYKIEPLFAHAISSPTECDALLRPVTSLAAIHSFLQTNANELARLVHQATGYELRSSEITNIADETQKVLHAYVFHEWHRTDPDAVNISMADCIAAISAIKIQKKIKTKYTPYWKGQISSEKTVSRLLSHLDPSRDIGELYEEDYIPQGAMITLYHRYCIVFSLLFGRNNRMEAFMKFQLAYLKHMTIAHSHFDLVAGNEYETDINIFCEDLIQYIEDQATSHAI